MTHEDEIISGTTKRCLSYTANAMPADALVTLGARASVSMVLTLKASEKLTKYECHIAFCQTNVVGSAPMSSKIRETSC